MSSLLLRLALLLGLDSLSNRRVILDSQFLAANGVATTIIFAFATMRLTAEGWVIR